MGLITAVSSAIQDSSSGVTGVESGTLPSIGISEATGIAVAVALLYLLAYLNLLEAAGVDAAKRRKVASQAVPLAIAFGAIVLYHSLKALRWLG